MTDFDFDEIEEELDVVVPDIYRLFIENIDSHGYDPVSYTHLTLPTICSV